MRLWICEKPSQARDIANVLGNARRKDGYIETNQGIVTWGFGHLLESAKPEDYNPANKLWAMECLPIIPETWKLLPRKDAKAQLATIDKLLKGAESVVIATDADREGESIGREILDHFRFKGMVERLWISALDDASIRKALANILPGSKTAPLYEAAKARSRADWLVGMNLTRAATLALSQQGVLSVGRVQTPTLALVVRRDEDIEAFKSCSFYEIEAQVDTEAGNFTMKHTRKDEDRIFDRTEAEVLVKKVNGARNSLSVVTVTKKEGPPKLFSLSEFQKTANKRWGWSADQALKIAQSLYENHKATTYPRSDCSFMPEEQATDIPKILGNLERLSEFSGVIPGNPEIRKSIWNSEKVTAHHAIIPTTHAADLSRMSVDERKAYLLIAQRYIACLSPEYVYDQTTIALNANGVPFKAIGRVDVAPGWKLVFKSNPEDEGRKEAAESGDAAPLPPVKNGDMGELVASKIVEKQTQPPARYTEGTLISDMAAVAKFATKPDVKARLKETSGIGTEATRASIIETLKKRGFLVTKGKQILSTDAGRKLIHALPPELADPSLTALWEDFLEEIAQGLDICDRFVEACVKTVNTNIERVRKMQGVHISTNAGNGHRKSNGKGRPTSKMVSFAEKLAKSKRIKLPASVKADFDACRKFLDEHAGTNSR